MRWLALLACLLASLALCLAWQLGGGATRSVSPAGPTPLPTQTPDTTLETVVAMLGTLQPTATQTFLPVPTPKPTQTPVPYCWDVERGMCMQATPTPTRTPYPTVAPPATLGPCLTPAANGTLPKLCWKG